MKNSVVFFFCMMLLFSCSKDDGGENPGDLKERFHGKYALISSNSEEAVDLNMDGIASNNLLSENVEISTSGVELRILGGGGHLFTESWPVETIVVPRGEKLDTTRYHPNYRIYYALYGNFGSCRFSDDFRSIYFLGEYNRDATNTLIYIESITLMGNETIEVVVFRKLYTMKGWIRTKIASRYKRFTKVT